MKTALGLVLAIASGCASAQTGASIYSMMLMPRNSPEAFAALSYVRGYFDATVIDAKFAGDVGAPSARVTCIPDTATLDQAHDVFKAFLARNPSRRNEPAGVLAFEAFGRAWPCK